MTETGKGEIVVGISPPPRVSDVLFGPGPDWQANACVNFGPTEVAYQSGFRQAAHYLAERVCDTRREQDFLIYPIVYLYRHHIELALKSLITLGNFLLDRQLSATEKRTLGQHDLADLWKLAGPLFNSVGESSGDGALPPADVEGIDSYIRQLHAHDPDGQRFRYAKTRKHASSLNPDLHNINIRDFAIALEKLADYLNALKSWFDQLADQTNDTLPNYEDPS